MRVARGQGASDERNELVDEADARVGVASGDLRVQVKNGWVNE